MDLGELGKRIQALRGERGMTLQELASTASVSVSMLSSVERGQKAPTVVVLARIAEGLGVPLTELLDQGPRTVLRRAAEQDVVDEPGGWRRVVLSPVVPGVNFEWIRSSLPPHCAAGEYPAYAPGSHEFVVVESGGLRIGVGAEVYHLEAGDSLYFSADAVHSYANLTAEPCHYYIAALIMRPRNAAPVRRWSAADPGA
ncbi:helix-turn-helix domain-containing protein [Sciscionella marina]|uniref:helix-turn-helix domain-containing protein n=1 Tax=Sciscionella marina TaxID=508770 RepID=UPI00036D9888|nr:helix-turn-helix domain-containing protein [Sciscionella marina]